MKACQLNKFLHAKVEPANREAFLAGEGESFKSPTALYSVPGTDKNELSWNEVRPEAASA